MILAPAGGGTSRTLLTNWQDTFYLAFSPDSKTIAALRGPEVGKRKLVLIDVATGTQTVVASGYFSGFSFSPDGTELAYSKASSEKYPPRSDVYRFQIPIGQSLRFVPRSASPATTAPRTPSGAPPERSSSSSCSMPRSASTAPRTSST